MRPKINFSPIKYWFKFYTRNNYKSLVLMGNINNTNLTIYSMSPSIYGKDEDARIIGFFNPNKNNWMIYQPALAACSFSRYQIKQFLFKYHKLEMFT